MAIRTLEAEPAEAIAPPPRDHNKPPLEDVIPLEFREALLATQPNFLTKLDLLIDAAGRAQAVDDETFGKCGDLVDSYRKFDAHVTATHKAVKDPYLQGGRLVDAQKNELAGRIADARAVVQKIGDAYVAKRDAEAKAERERVMAEQQRLAAIAAEAERKRLKAEQEREIAERAKARAERKGDEDALAAAEARRLAALQVEAAAQDAIASAALAPAMPTIAEPVRSDEGSIASGKQDWCSQVTDYRAAFVAVEDNPKVRDAIDKAIASLVRAGKRSIPGCRVWPVAKASFR